MAEYILVTGGTGFIGSHSCVALMEAGYQPLIIDNLANSSARVIERLGQLTGTQPKYFQGDIRDATLLEQLFTDYQITAVLHFAGLKAVGESVLKPLEYYDNNISGAVTLLAVMLKFGVKTLVFSSSATVYGKPATVPITEKFPCNATNPYGRSKIIFEEILADLYRADPTWRIGCLRYFNPVGAHESGLIGEDPRGVPSNLMPYLLQVALGRYAQLQIFGGDYPTVDGTGVRDYIHVMDLAEGHVAALAYLKVQPPGLVTVNLGVGHGVSVLQMVRAFERVSGKSVPCQVVGRRVGDVAECFADVSLGAQLFGWRAKRSIFQMCQDAWRWQTMNPQGYEGS